MNTISVKKMKEAMENLIKQGYGDLPVVMLHPVYADEYFKNKSEKRPLTTVESTEIVNDFTDEDKQAVLLLW